MKLKGILAVAAFMLVMLFVFAGCGEKNDAPTDYEGDAAHPGLHLRIRQRFPKDNPLYG